MAINRRFKRKALLLSAAFTAGMFSLTVFSYVSLAWFMGQRAATVNFASMTVSGGGLSASVRYFDKNATTESGTVYYDGYNVNALSASSYFDAFSYGNDFLDPGSSSDPFSMAHFNPGYASSYCVEITNSSSSPLSVGLFLLAYEASESSDNFHVDETVGGHAYSATDAFNLCEATRVYTAWTVASDPSSVGKSFLQKTFLDSASSSTQNDGVGNVFAGYTAGGASLITLSSPASWMPSSAAAIPSNGKGYLFVTFYFSNDSSTYYYESTASFSDGKTHFAKTASDSTEVTPSSNPYMATSATSIPTIAFPSLTVAPV